MKQAVGVPRSFFSLWQEKKIETIGDHNATVASQVCKISGGYVCR
jgi:hypothetical protein